MDEASQIVEAMHADLEDLADAASAKTARAIRLAMAVAWKEVAGRGGVWSAAAAQAALMQLTAAMRVALAAEAGPEYARRAIAATKRAARRQAALLRTLDRRFLGSARALNFDALKWAESQGERLGAFRLRGFQASMGRYGVGVVAAVEDAVTANALLGKPWYEAERVLKGKISGVLADEQWKIDRIMRTETAAVYNGALLASLEEEDDDDEPMLKRLSATFDKVTGADSVAAHGQVRKVGEPFQDIRGRLYQAPPNRPHDREVVLPHRASWGPTPPPLGGPREEGSGMRRGSGDASPETLRATARLAEITSDVNDLRKRRDAGAPIDPLLREARKRLQEGQVVLAANRAGDRKSTGKGVRPVSGAWVSLGGIGARVVGVGQGAAALSIGGQRVDVPLSPRGVLLGATPGKGSVVVPEALRPAAAAMLRASLSR